MWTLDELVARVAGALAGEYPGAPNGRVREVPDRRAIRWYTTIALVDRPLGMRGRSALYGPRHLLQLVAVKRRQAAGRTLAEIQAELAGATDEHLRAVARVPADLLVPDGPAAGADRAPSRTRFWAAPAPGPAAATTTAAPAAARSTSDANVVGNPATADTGAAANHATAGAGAAGNPATADAGAAGNPATADAGAAGSRAAALLGGVVLGGGAILVLPGLPSAADRVAVCAAARPLIDLLAERGLLNPDDGSPS